ncbi:PAS domain S-box protein [Roseivirga pacifica]
MKNKPILRLDKDFVLIERLLIPNSWIRAFHLEKGKPIHPLIEEAIKTGDSSDLRVAHNEIKLAFYLEHLEDSYHLHFHTNSNTILESPQNIDKYKLLVEAADDMIFETDLGGHFTYVNPKSVELTGYSREELVGMKYLELIREDWRPKVRDYYVQQYADSTQSTYLEFPITIKNGKEIWVGQRIQLLENDNAVYGMMAVARDITEEYKSRLALRQSEDKYRSIIENLKYGLMEVDLDERILFVNDAMCAITGYTREELIGSTAQEVLTSTDQKDVLDSQHAKRAKGDSSVYELKLLDKKGDEHWVLISGAPIYDINGKLTGTMGIHVDITDRKQAEQELINTQHRLDRYKQGIESINEITSNQALSLQDQLIAGLKNAANFLGLPIGIVSEVVGDEYSIKEHFLLEDGGELENGQRFDLTETYCDLVYAQDRKIAVSDFGKSEYNVHPCYELFKLESYIGTTYSVNGYKRGTINFSSPTPRGTKFDAYDLEFIDILAKWVGYLVTQIENQDALDQERILLEEKNDELRDKENYLKAINDFVTKLLDDDTIHDISWEIAENVIDQFGYDDCVIYILNKEEGCLEQVAAYGSKIKEPRKVLDPIKVELGRGIVGSVAQTGKAEIIGDTSKDKRYLVDDAVRLSEITVPIISDGEVLGVIDSEHPDKDYFTDVHLDTLTTIANLASNRLKNAIAKGKQLKAEAELKDSERKLRNIIDSAIDGVITIDKAGLVTEWNRQAEVIFGFREDEVIGKPLTDTIIPEEYREAHNRGMSHYLSTGEGPVLNQKIEITALRKNGEEFPIELAIIPVMMKGEHSFTAFVSDITLQKKVQDEMEKALQKEVELNELKSRFVSMTSHEFRTPLTTIKQNTDLMSYKLENKYPEQAKEFEKYLSRIESEITRVTGLMNDILMLGRIESGKMVVKKSPTELPKFCQNIIDTHTANRADGRTVNLTLAGVPRPVHLDDQLFGHVVNNLVSNAFKYSEGKPNPEMTLKFTELKHVVLHIKDYGIGIPKKDQKGLFQSFFRATNVRNIQGTGLGLSIVKEFTEMHGGTISLESDKDQGTEFIVEIPYE